MATGAGVPISPAASTPEIKHGQTPPSKTISCARCQQRKVKCDKVLPSCSNCSKQKVECTYVAPAPSRRKKRKSPEEELLDRLRRYEDLLTQHRIPFDHDDSGLTCPARSTGSQGDSRASVCSPHSWNSGVEETGGQFVMDGGKASFIETGLWNNLSEELRLPRDMQCLTRFSLRSGGHISAEGQSEGLLNAGDLFLASAAYNPTYDLKAAHPNPIDIFRLWQVFLDNVDPLTKVVHAPTMQHRMLELASHLDDISKEWEALLFTVYLSAVNSMPSDDCESMFKTTKGTMLRKYLLAARTALVRADFTSCSDVLLTQAFFLYLLSIRQYCEPNSLWVLTGTCVRLCQRLGLHRDGTHLGLSPFETEMRRRIWWQVLSLDGQTGELCGAGLSSPAPLTDSEKPLNINDSDLNPNMSTLPPEREGPTEMMFCAMRSEIGLFLRDHKQVGKFLRPGGGYLVKFDILEGLDDLDAIFHRKYLRFCDSNVPFHQFVLLVGTSIVEVLRLISRHPRKFRPGNDVPPEQRRKTFSISLNILEVYNQSLSMKSIQRYLWQLNVQFQWHGFVILAHELKFRPDDEEARRAWEAFEVLFDYNHDVIMNEDTALHKAVSKLVLPAWSVREAHLRKHGTGAIRTPGFVATLQEQKNANGEDSPWDSRKDLGLHTANTNHSTEMRDSGGEWLATYGGNERSDNSGMRETLVTEGYPATYPEDAINWSEWDDMLQNFEFQTSGMGQN